ncbi:MAG: hypothetical protein AAGA75_21490 [Cyanobacteria bacterium P01_E01_bin.6]
MSDHQIQVMAALEKYFLEEETRTEQQKNHCQRLESAAEMVDLDVAFTPVVVGDSIDSPRRATRLQNGNYGIYNVGSYRANMGPHMWDVPGSLMKQYRAFFLLQRDQFYRDLVVMEHYKNAPDEPALWFHTWRGERIINPCWQIKQNIISLYFPEGIFIPGRDNLLSGHIVNAYVEADGTVDVPCLKLSF